MSRTGLAPLLPMLASVLVRATRRVPGRCENWRAHPLPALPARYAVAVKPKHEAEMFKAALRAGIRYAEGRGAVEFEPTDSASDKALYVYRLLVHDKLIAPLPEDQVGEKTIRHRLALWYAHLPAGHPLLG